MSINDRIKHLRAHLGLSQSSFAATLKVGASAIAKLESAVNNPSEQTIKLICNEFGVSYDWLKNGVEPMMMPADEAKAEKVSKWLDGDNEFVKQVFYGLADMPKEWWEQAETMLRSVLEQKKDR